MAFGIKAVAGLAAGVALAFSQAAVAQDYPNKPIRVLVSSAAGGPVDIAARVLGQKLSETWGQPITVENRPGAGEVIGTEQVARSAPDGYTLLVVSLNPFTINPVVFAKLGYDPEKGFAPISTITVNPMVVTTTAKSPYNSLRDMLADSKSRTGGVTWSTPGLATSNHMAGEWLQAETNTKWFHVPYKGGPAAMNAVINGEVQFGVVSLVQVVPLVKAGTVKALAVTTGKRTPLAPDWATVAEQIGMPGFDASVRTAMFAPAGTPRPVVTRINTDVNRLLNTAEMRERFSTLGAEPSGSTPEELAALIARARAQMAQVVQRNGIKVEQ